MLSLEELQCKKRISKIFEKDIDNILEDIQGIENINFQGKTFMIKNNIFEVPKCRKPDCEKHVYFIDKKSRFSHYCSNECNLEDAPRNLKVQINNKFGYDSLMHDPTFQKKLKEGVINKYGVDNVMKVKEISEKSKNNYRKKYGNPVKVLKEFFIKNGVENVRQLPGINEKIISTVIQKYGVDNVMKDDEILKRNRKSSGKTTPNRLEMWVMDILDSKKVSYEYGYIKSGKEIDIFIKDHMLGIEINGNYWHTEENGKGRNFHIDKTQIAYKNGIRLLHIFEDEILFKPEIVKSKLLHILGLNSNNKIYARNCNVREIDTTVKNEFLEKNHIQGRDSSNIKLGLFDSNENLVAVMTFSEPRFSLGMKNPTGGNDMYELSRFASDINSRVVGGFSKLLKFFKRKYKFSKIYTYADIRWSSMDDNIYTSNGFMKVGISKPSYYYLSKENIYKRLNRYQFRKSELLKLFPEYYDEKLSEYEIMKKTNKYFRIWNCGNIKYEIDINDYIE